ncbi:glycosyltransferase family 4 protein [Epilithonimonas hispanica]|uniref:Glycosyltransferase n=1 Tax=Epilithonimonas hispanica TaxID=358687 RepID=A0A3D9CQN2_9FLAO|nr:glycosyltransferase family 4 protein [Epilithonimonas hispanica]REC68105.1 glycosyltransferase [Epilithonimonas hispanica]
MIINVASFGGRTHMLDLARELEKCGHTVRFYSYVRTRRSMEFGLKKECSYSLFGFAIPFLILFKFFGHGRWREDLYNFCCDWMLSWYMKPCDIFIGQSPMHIKSIKAAKKRFGAITILERGISHVDHQAKVLQSIPSSAKNMSRLHIKRDLKGYIYPDFISVGSDHVNQTFLERGFESERIFVNNYGVNLKSFYPTSLSNENPYDLILVGQWSYRKGCDLILEVVKRMNLRFLHVGPLVDLDFPTNDKCFTHIDPVNEKQLVKYYQQAKVFVLPSRDEGLALVQPQALACGLPLVCSAYSGGRDLKKFIIDENFIQEMDKYDVDSLEEKITLALILANNQKGLRNIMQSTESLSFKAYGDRYNDFLKKITKK